MTDKEKDAIVIFLVTLAGAWGFGSWQHSFYAGLFMYAALSAVRGIGYAIEYKEKQ